MSPFLIERRIFSAFKEGLAGNPDILGEMERALHEVLTRYDTSVPENRFIAGALIEYVVGLGMRACEIDIRHAGESAKRVDLCTPDGLHRFSIKGIIKGDGTNLINFRGMKKKIDLSLWQEATIFVISGYGMVYTDPGFDWWRAHGKTCFSLGKDALVIKKQCVVEFALHNPGFFIECLIPAPESNKTARSAGSYNIVKRLLGDENAFPHLFPEIGLLFVPPRAQSQ